MKAIVTVMLKDGVLDPQGKAIGHALHTLGFPQVGDVRAGNPAEPWARKAASSMAANRSRCGAARSGRSFIGKI